jgi:Ran GTPase-activating protein (RanGAP) involved in mRNA processing and transport
MSSAITDLDPQISQLAELISSVELRGTRPDGVHLAPPIASWSPGPSVPRSAWINTASCEICGARFSFRRRRHHCRRCGKCVCDAPRCADTDGLPVACELDPTCTQSLIGLEVPAGFGCSACLADIHVANAAIYAAAQERYARTVQAEAEQSDAAEAAALRVQAEAEERESLRAQAERDAEAEARRLAEKTLVDAAAAKRGAEAKAMQAVAPCETAAEAGSQLTAAAKAADEASMARLLDAFPGCVNWANNWGCTALHYACMGRAREGAAALLVRRGADRNMRNGGIPGHPTHGDPKTPLDIASAALRERLLAIDPSEAEGLGRNSTSVPDPAATEAERSVLGAIAAAEAGGTLVYLRFCDIGDAGATQLADMLRDNATVTEMGLGENQIGGEGARALADGLRENATVTEISLRSNQIGNEGARALADGLWESATVTEVDLCDNRIGDDGARAVADWLRKNATVTRMGLGENQIGDEGARALADGLRENATVTIVDLGLNPMGDTAEQAVLDIVDQNRDDPAAAAARVAAAVGAVAVPAAEAALAKPKFATPSDRQTTALLEGAKSGDAAAVEKALADGADKDYLDASASGGAALHYAAMANHASVVELLASKGADVNIRNKGGWLPLHRAAWTGDGCSAAIEALLKAGADPTLTCVDGSDALKIADGAGVTTLIRAHLEAVGAVAAPPAAGGAASAEAAAEATGDFAFVAEGYAGANASCLGVFVRQEEMVQGRPTYKAQLERVPDQVTFLFYCTAGCWRVGPDTSDPRGWWRVESAAMTPGAITEVWAVPDDGEGWTEVASARIVGRAAFEAAAAVARAAAPMAAAQAEVNAAARAALKGAFEAMRGGAVEVSVAYLGIGDVGAGMLAEELRGNTTLRFVRLNGSQVTDVGAGQLADALRTNASVEVLDLGDNSIGEAGATQLADALRTNTSVENLDLGSNLIGDAGAAQLADALRTNTSVEVLNLDENSIGEAGATQLAGALRANTSVKKLGLAGNSIGDAGATQLADALRTNTVLEGLHLVGNPMSETALQAVFGIVDQNMDDPVAAAGRAASHTTK